MAEDDSLEAFRNRKDWNAHDLTKLRAALIDWQISHQPIAEFIETIAQQFPTRSKEAIEAKMVELKEAQPAAVQSRLEEVPEPPERPETRTRTAKFDSRYNWTEEEVSKLQHLLSTFDANKGDSALNWGRQLQSEFPGRSAGSISQRILKLGYSQPSKPRRRAPAAAHHLDPFDAILAEVDDLESGLTGLRNRIDEIRTHQNDPSAMITQAIEALRQFDTRLALDILQKARRK